jgi:hypothetical protein
VGCELRHVKPGDIKTSFGRKDRRLDLLPRISMQSQVRAKECNVQQLHKEIKIKQNTLGGGGGRVENER